MLPLTVVYKLSMLAGSPMSDCSDYAVKLAQRVCVRSDGSSEIPRNVGWWTEGARKGGHGRN